ncbi:hypothetical protein [Hymenobacter chitinivorans]|uniref:Uncharacterized protein n=1 Tax=Hymenobacter chitinivorans DSM 11115 TaxID=1121954 RepID=A0A2M9AS84_9BACT|nr:hypothetical protein [Hymenobacter chitinivorans]PJJ48537.1 hypothetical protein CLV45_4246 [Hymenobacter chitinivorans DSM 11115]
MSDPAPVSRSAQRHLDLIRHHEETLARYQADPAVAEWLRQFRGDGARFLERYATERASALVDGRSFWDINQREEADLVQEATERLWEIQQRKLFELQCRWRAEEVRLPAELVVLSQDFERWGARIEQCPLVPPIAAAEVESYLAYLLSDACTDADDDSGRPREWQNYERFRRYLLLEAEGQDPEQVRREAGRNPEPGLGGLMGMLADFFLDYPAWYAHCDAVAGPPNLVLYLPDLRGEKEEYYRHLGRTGKAPDVYEEPDGGDEPAPVDPPLTAPDADPPLRYLSYNQFDSLTDTLMREFETPELLRFHEALLHEPTMAPVAAPGTDDDDDDDYEQDDENEAALAELGAEAGRVLLEIPERLPIEAHPDWRVALHRTWLGWRKQRLATALQAAYADYAAREQAGQPHPSPYSKSDDLSDLARKSWKQVRKLILKGRERAGEPRDFNF